MQVQGRPQTQVNKWVWDAEVKEGRIVKLGLDMICHVWQGALGRTDAGVGRHGGCLPLSISYLFIDRC